MICPLLCYSNGTDKNGAKGTTGHKQEVLCGRCYTRQRQWQ